MHSLFPVILFLIVPNLAFAPLAHPVADLAEDTSVTNGERLARGLPLLKPKWRDPTRARRSYPSPSPKVPPTGPGPARPWTQGRIIPVLAADNTKLGYLGASFSEKGGIQITQDATSAMLVRFRARYRSSTEATMPLEILNGHKGLLAAVATNSNDFDLPSQHLGILGSSLDSSGKSNSYSEATSVRAAVETNIWKFDSSTNRLTAKWVDEDKLSHSLEFLLTALGEIHIVGSPHDSEAFPGMQKIRFIFEAEAA
ncbi:hypothetical protein BS47DRAFT_1367358 [Hydnum rufescens UP504]|uniref:Lectin n=1 Tax=Hydnum rufescens UP504 TaxID=1448309 RepID=A0A9P6DKW9_9AGAM|nr:hypothetical protein BS47DRAFT_1367358 [Hydnum rufescens UP504]